VFVSEAVVRSVSVDAASKVFVLLKCHFQFAAILRFNLMQLTTVKSHSIVDHLGVGVK
jgi:hypothetical protein